MAHRPSRAHRLLGTPSLLGSPASSRAHLPGAGSWHVAGRCATLQPPWAPFSPLELRRRRQGRRLRPQFRRRCPGLRAWVAPHTIGNRPAAARVRAAGLDLYHAPDLRISLGGTRASPERRSLPDPLRGSAETSLPRSFANGLPKQGPLTSDPLRRLSVFVVVLLLLAPAGPHPPRGGSQGKLLERLPRRHLLELPLPGSQLLMPSYR